MRDAATLREALQAAIRYMRLHTEGVSRSLDRLRFNDGSARRHRRSIKTVGQGGSERLHRTSTHLGARLKLGEVTCGGRAGDCLPVYDDLAPASTSAPPRSTGKLSKTMAGRLARRSPGARGGEARPAVSRVRGDRAADRIECALPLGQILVSASATPWNTQSQVTECGRARSLKFRGVSAGQRRKQL
jgi:hypothetical protein